MIFLKILQKFQNVNKQIFYSIRDQKLKMIIFNGYNNILCSSICHIIYKNLNNITLPNKKGTDLKNYNKPKLNLNNTKNNL